MFAEDEARLLLAAARDEAMLASLLDRRLSGVPLEHVLGWVEFCGRRLVVEPGVFVPRARSALLVRLAAELVRAARQRSGASTPLVAVDLCCGSGAVGAALAWTVPDLELHAVDVDARAVRCARRNLEPLGARVYEGDVDAPLPARLLGRVDVVLANAPYVPSGELPLLPVEAREHEPRAAVDGGSDGLDVARRVVAAAPRWLTPGASLVVETSERQSPAAVAVVAAAGLRARIVRCERLDATAVIGTREGP